MYMEMRDSLLIMHALAVLRQYAKDRVGEPGPALKLALRVLAGYLPDDHDLFTYWRVANNPSSEQRRGHLVALTDTIKRKLVAQALGHTAAP